VTLCLVTEPRSILYDADGNETDDEASAVRGVVVEVDDEGNEREVDSWTVDPRPDVDPQ
jgi:hypothetical protein